MKPGDLADFGRLTAPDHLARSICMTEPRIPKNDRRAPVTFDFFHAQRRRLVSLAYRMLGSRAEAEDVVQDAWLKWHASASGNLREPAAWLTTIVTRLSIDRLRALQTERAAQENGRLPDVWTDMVVPSAEKRVLDGAQLSYGLMLLLERLSPDERTAFLLREAFDCDYAAISATIGKQTDHCRQLIHRAKTRLARESALAKPVDAERQRPIVEQLRHAIAAQDEEALLEALARDIPVAAVAVASAHAETVSLGEEAGVAMIVDGDITALYTPCVDAQGQPAVNVMTQEEELAALNATCGRDAIFRLLRRISREADFLYRRGERVYVRA
jgi:RNA polymerase sigma factor (sigma-70 family)